ncbi:MAG: hypothetical protein AAGF12_13620 [Myxococcota bacterium]
MRPVALFLLAVSSWGDANLASAHPLIDLAAARFEQAEFEAALALCRDAKAGDDLTRTDLARLYELEALVHTALGNDPEAWAAFEQLAVVDPSYRADPTTPPEFQEALTAAVENGPGPIALSAAVAWRGATLSVAAVLRNDRLGLVREVHLYARSEGGEWEGPSVGSIDIRSRSGSAEYYLQAVGPGGVILANEGSGDTPRVAHAALGPEDDSEDGLDWGLILGIGAGVVAAAVGVLVLLLATAPEDETIVEGPIFE